MLGIASWAYAWEYDSVADWNLILVSPKSEIKRSMNLKTMIRKLKDKVYEHNAK